MAEKNKNKQTFSWMNPKLIVKNTKKYGQGVFAKENIKKGEIVAIFGGYIMTLGEINKLPGKLKDTGLTIAENFAISIKKFSEDEDTNCFNHSCDPNCGICGQILLVAMKNIDKNEEITFDYAMVLSDDEKYKIKCKCGKDNCRKIISNADWKKTKLQNKYKGYFSYFIQEKINKNKNKKHGI